MVRLRLEQGRIHIGMRLGARGQSLKRLGPSDLAAIDGHGRVVRHVLRFERQHLDAAVGQCPAEPGYQHRFAHVRRSEEHTSELQSLMRSSYAVFCLKKKKKTQIRQDTYTLS